MPILAEITRKTEKVKPIANGIKSLSESDSDSSDSDLELDFSYDNLHSNLNLALSKEQMNLLMQKVI